MIRVLIVDNHPVAREGLKRIFAGTPDIVAEGEAGNGPSAIELTRKKAFDLVAIDLSVPRMDGLDILKMLKALKPELPVLMVSAYPEAQYGTRCLSAGASGYLTKESPPDEFISAVRRIAGGKRYIVGSLAKKLLETSIKSDEKPLDSTLSDREYQVLCMIACGRKVKEIAGSLSLSPKTVASHRVRVLHLTGLKNDVEPARYAIRHGLVPAD